MSVEYKANRPSIDGATIRRIVQSQIADAQRLQVSELRNGFRADEQGTRKTLIPSILSFGLDASRFKRNLVKMSKNARRSWSKNAAP